MFSAALLRFHFENNFWSFSGRCPGGVAALLALLAWVGLCSSLEGRSRAEPGAARGWQFLLAPLLWILRSSPSTPFAPEIL